MKTHFNLTIKSGKRISLTGLGRGFLVLVALLCVVVSGMAQDQAATDLCLKRQPR